MDEGVSRLHAHLLLLASTGCRLGIPDIEPDGDPPDTRCVDPAPSDTDTDTDRPDQCPDDEAALAQLNLAPPANACDGYEWIAVEVLDSPHPADDPCCYTVRHERRSGGCIVGRPLRGRHGGPSTAPTVARPGWTRT